MPFYNINGDRDYQTNFNLAQKYFDEIDAPYKQMFIMKNTTHGLLESKSEEFSDILHKIVQIEINRTSPLKGRGGPSLSKNACLNERIAGKETLR